MNRFPWRQLLRTPDGWLFLGMLAFLAAAIVFALVRFHP